MKGRFGPRSNWKVDTSWCIKQLNGIRIDVSNACRLAWSKSSQGRKGKACPAGYWGADWLSGTTNELANALSDTSVAADCPHVKTFLAEVQRLRHEGEVLTEKGASDEELWAFLAGEVIKIFLDCKPAEFTTSLMNIAFPVGTPMRTIASELSAAVSTSESAHPDTGKSKAHNQMRLDAVLSLLEEQVPEMIVDGQIKAMVVKGVRSSKLMSHIISRSDVNITARACKPGSARRAIAIEGFSGSVAPRAKPTWTPPPAASQDSTPPPVLSRYDKAARRRHFRVHAMESDNHLRDGRACHNCGESGHFWLTCSQPYSKQRWRAAVDQAGAGSRLAKIAPRTEEYFQDMQKRFSQRATPPGRGN
jgi:hypothetical protein